MKSAYLLPTVHIALTHSVVWAFFVALSLLAIECVVIARSNRQPRRATRRCRQSFVLPQRHPH